jgi:uncharacterized membrane protein
MNAAHLHLITNHFPIVLLIVGCTAFAIALVQQNPFWKRMAALLVIAGAISSLPAFLSGEGAEEIVEKSGASDSLIEPHEKAAKIAFALTLAAGAVALVLGFALFKGSRFIKPLTWLAAVVTLVATVFIVYAGMTGGKIMHPELRDAKSSAGEVKTREAGDD